jgi:uncharacterized protein
VSAAAQPGGGGPGASRPAGPEPAATAPAGQGPAGPGLAALTAGEVAAVLGMSPHREGGYFRETYRSPIVIPTPAGSRSLCTSILYLLTAADPSRFHRLRFDELWFFHAGSPVEMVFLDPVETTVVGPEGPQALAPGGRWMAARIAGVAPSETGPPGPAWALVGCVVDPGFDYEDFEAGEREALLAAYPQAAEYVRALT